MEDEQGGFRRGRGCVDQVFGLKMCEKYLGNGRDLYVAFMDLEKAYDKIDRKAMWQVLQVLWGRWEATESCERFLQGK